MFRVLVLSCLLLGVEGIAVDWSFIAKRLTPREAASAESKTIAASEFQPALAPGMVVSGVNLFNGQPNYQLPLAGINARGLLNWGLSLSYSGGVRPILTQSNARAPAGWVGLGWSLNLPYVVVDHKGTVALTDDLIYCNLGPYGGGQLLQNSEGAFFLSTNPYVKIYPKEVANQFVSWLFVFPDGNKMFFGETAAARRIQRAMGARIAAYPTTVDESSEFIYRWDISRLTTFNELTAIHFSFEPIQEMISESTGYTRESHPQKIYWNDANGKEVEAIHFQYGDLGAKEYSGYSATESKDAQLLYETKYLQSLVHTIGNEQYRTINFSYTLLDNPSVAVDPKRLLAKVAVTSPASQAKVWTFAYDTDASQMLSDIVNPDHTTDHYSYKKMEYPSYYNVVHSDKVRTIYRTERFKSRDSTYHGIIGPGYQDNKAYWKVYGYGIRNGYRTYCTSELCYVEIHDDRIGLVENIFLQIYKVRGTYFEYDTTFAYSGAETKRLFLQDDYFIVSDSVSRAMEMWEWNGEMFEKKNGELNGIFTDANAFAGVIAKIIPEKNYFLIETEFDGVHRIYPAVRDPSTGLWKMLPSNKSDCGFANVGNYGESIRDLTSPTCLEWEGAIELVNSQDMFVVGQLNRDVLSVYYLKDGSFKEMRSADLFPELATQSMQRHESGHTYTMNFEWNLERLTFRGNVLVGEFNSGHGTDVFLAMIFDGKRFHEAAFYSYGDENNTPSDVYILDNYMVEVAYDNARVRLWRKAIVGGIPRFVLTEQPGIASDGDIFMRILNGYSVRVAATNELLYLECVREDNYLPASSGRTKDYFPNLWYLPSDPSLKPSRMGIEKYITGLDFSQTEPVVRYQTMKNKEGTACTDWADCHINYYTARIKRYGGDYSTNRQWSEFAVNETLIKEFAACTSLVAWSAPNRSMGGLNLNRNTYELEISLYRYMGDSYYQPGNSFVVDKVWRDAGTGSDDEQQKTVQAFVYPTNSLLPMYNSDVQSAQFKNTCIKNQKWNSNENLNTSCYEFITDGPGYSLGGYSINLQGMLSRIDHRTGSGALLGDVSQDFTSTTYGIDEGDGLGWPTGMVRNYVKSTTSYLFGPWQSTARMIESWNALADPVTGQPIVAVTKNGNDFLVQQTITEKINLDVDGSHTMAFSQPVQQIVYQPMTVDPTATIEAADPKTVLFPDKVSAMSRMTYDNQEPSRVLASYGWQARDYQATDAKYRNATIVPFRSDTGLVLQSMITQRNQFGQVTELKTPGIGGDRFSCTVYEGKRSLPVGNLAGASCRDGAIAMAEDGVMPGYNGWEFGGTTLDDQQVFNGLYSYKVTDHYGPTRNLKLKESSRLGYDLVISVWGYAQTEARPMLIAEFRKANGELVRLEGAYNPIETFRSRKWQRWELVVTAEQLRTSGLFNGENVQGNYLRIWFGMGEPKGNPDRVVYVDDFTVYPSTSTYALTTYRNDGQVLSRTNTLHETVKAVYDKLHVLRGFRDKQGRLFQDKAFIDLHQNEVQ